MKNLKQYLQEQLVVEAEEGESRVLVQWTFGENAAPTADPDFNLSQAVMGSREQVTTFVEGKMKGNAKAMKNGAVVKEFAVNADGTFGRGAKRVVQIVDGEAQWLPLGDLTNPETSPVVLGSTATAAPKEDVPPEEDEPPIDDEPTAEEE